MRFSRFFRDFMEIVVAVVLTLLPVLMSAPDADRRPVSETVGTSHSATVPDLNAQGRFN